MHHIISDGTSMNIMSDTISRAYSGEDVAPEKFSGYEVSLKEQEDRSGESLAKAREYYDNLLAGFDRDFLPKGDMYHPDPSADGLFVFEGAPIVDKAEKICEQTGTTVNGLICSAFGFNLARYNGSDHVIFTTVYNGRSDSRTVNSVSMFVKTIPVLCNIADESVPPMDLTKEIGKQLVDSMGNDIYSFAEISRELEVKPDVMIVYQGDDFEFQDFCGKHSDSIQLRLSGEKEPILFQMAKEGDHFKYYVEYDKDRFSGEFMGYFTRAVDETISEFITCSSLKEICVTDERTMDVVRKMNDTDAPFDKGVTVVDMFRKQAK